MKFQCPLLRGPGKTGVCPEGKGLAGGACEACPSRNRDFFTRKRFQPLGVATGLEASGTFLEHLGTRRSPVRGAAHTLPSPRACCRHHLAPSPRHLGQPAHPGISLSVQSPPSSCWLPSFFSRPGECCLLPGTREGWHGHECQPRLQRWAEGVRSTQCCSCSHAPGFAGHFRHACELRVPPRPP